MAEIVNVTAQLEEIVAALKIPVNNIRPAPKFLGAGDSAKGTFISSSAMEDYFCCIGLGMIQFVCTREGRGKTGTYRSMTQDKIIIHPGSVMFRADPQYIVAGEIVRT